MPELSIIIPIYNEARLINESLPKIFNLALDKEVIVINDGSNDGSLEKLKNLKNNYEFQLISLTKNQGKGTAVRRGLSEAKSDYFIICDADLEYEPRDIVRLLNKIKTLPKNTALYGSRFLNNKSWSGHYLVNKFLTDLSNLLFNAQLSDMETCLKLIPRSALASIKLKAKRFELEPELTAQLLKNNYKIQEIPISYQRRNYAAGK
ncbi:MAG: glycosyltransferase family 2 protein [Candidatus Falkowbacteria bacterium]|nr:glycosyltransferase family 2 protein [Candidatus Falkowbacteria bacterium]